MAFTGTPQCDHGIGQADHECASLEQPIGLVSL